MHVLALRVFSNMARICVADAVSYYTIAFDFLSRVSPTERQNLVANVCAELVDPSIKFTGGDGDGPTLRIQL